jgi:hypothetical protein
METGMSSSIPAPIACYLAAANAQNVAGAATCFTETAVVHDERRTRQGMAAIEAWVKDVSETYSPVVEVLDVVTDNSGIVVVMGRVSGHLPGSPVDLSYAFRLEGDRIAALEIRPWAP